MVGDHVGVLQTTRGVWLRARVIQESEANLFIQYDGFGEDAQRLGCKRIHVLSVGLPKVRMTSASRSQLQTRSWSCTEAATGQLLSPQCRPPSDRSLFASRPMAKLTVGMDSLCKRRAHDEASEATEPPPPSDDAGSDRMEIATEVDVRANSVAPPLWAGLGCEVECVETCAAFAGAYASGEVLEWLDEPTTAAAASEEGFDYMALSTYAQRGCLPRSRRAARKAFVGACSRVSDLPHALRVRWPTRRRTLRDAREAATAPLRQEVISSAPRIGQRVQLWQEGRWEASLDAVAPSGPAAVGDHERAAACRGHRRGVHVRYSRRMKILADA